MKKFYILIVSVLFTAAAWSQNKIWDGPATGGSWTTPANWSGNSVPDDDDVVVFGIGISGTITNVPNLEIRGLIISDGANITLSKPAQGGTNTLTITNTNAANEFVITEGSTLSLGNEINIALASGNGFNPNRASIAGEFNVNGRNYYTNSSNSSTTVQSTGTISVGNGGSVSSTNSSRLAFLAGASYIHGRDGGTIPTADWNTGSVCNITGVDEDAPTGMGQTFGSLTWNCVNQSEDVSLAGSGMSVAGTLSVISTGNGNDQLQMSQSNLIVGHFDLSGGIFRISSGTQRALTVRGNVAVSGGSLLMSTDDEDGTLNVAGNFSHTGGTITEAGDPGDEGMIVFNGSSVQTFTKSPAATISNDINFRIEDDAIVDFGTSVLNGSTGDFTLASGGKIITAHAQGLRSSGAFGSVQITGNRSYSSGADYEFQGATTGNFTTSGNEVRDLIINNTAGEVTAARTFVVDRALTLLNGYITPSAGGLTVSNSGTASTINGAFVNGQLRKVISNSNALFTFPVGKVDGGLRTIGIRRTGGSNSTFVAEFFRAAPESGILASGLARVSNCEYWDLSRSSGSVSVSVTLSWASNSDCSPATPYVTDPTTLRVAHLMNGTWRNEGRASSTGNNASGTITSSNNISTFSPFALASSSETENPLPVVFGDVRAYEKNNGVQIDWSNLTEKDVAHYTIERSSNGKDFSAIGQQLPTSNQDDRADYSAFDASPKSGTNYYRIKAEETTGKIVYSKVLSVSLGLTTQSLKLYPNPVKGNQVNISLSNVKSGQYDLRVVNMSGQDVFKQRISSQGSTMTQTIDLPASVAPGVYSMVITGGDYRETKTFIVQ